MDDQYELTCTCGWDGNYEELIERVNLNGADEQVCPNCLTNEGLEDI